MHSDQLCTETDLRVYVESQRCIPLIFLTSFSLICPHIFSSPQLDTNAGVSDSRGKETTVFSVSPSTYHIQKLYKTEKPPHI